MSGTRISNLLVKITILFVICCCNFSAQAKYGGGSGTANDPHLIYTAEQMNTIGIDSNDWDKNFKLMADIDLSGYPGTEFNIIGYFRNVEDNKPFTGVFDGNGFTVSNFTYVGWHLNYGGLFQYVGQNGEIRNLGMTCHYISSEWGGSGALVGLLYGGAIINCWTEGGEVSGSFRVGGLVGSLYEGSVTASYVQRGYVSGKNSYVGGLVGENLGDISNCYAACNVAGSTSVGGLVGSNKGEISKCYSTGRVTGFSSTGGLVGASSGQVSACLWDIETSGQATSAGGTGKTTDEMWMRSTFVDVGWDFGTPFWTINEGVDYPRLWWESEEEPKYGGGTGEQNNPYLIYTAKQMNAIGANPDDWDKHFKLMVDVDLSSYAGRKFNIIGYFRTDEDNKPFTGVFDGNGCTISNFTYFNALFDHVGLFGYLGENGEIKDLGMSNHYINGGRDCYGALVGWLHGGTITNCSVQGYIEGADDIGGLVGKNQEGNIINCYATCRVLGEGGLGGLVGCNSGTITTCHSSGLVYGTEGVGGLVGTNIGTITGCYAEGDSIKGHTYVGGLSGKNNGTITNCSTRATVIGHYEYVGCLVGLNEGIISHCYSMNSSSEGKHFVGGLVGENRGKIFSSCAVATVSGEAEVGGLAGTNNDAIIYDCYASGIVDGGVHVGGLVGCNSLSTISRCCASVSVKGYSHSGGLLGANSGIVTKCFATGGVQGHEYVGGLMGSNVRTIANCYSAGNVSGSSAVGGLVGWYRKGTLINCYSIGRVDGIEDAGGLVGYNDIGDVTASFWDIETSGQATSASGTGLPTVKMQMQITFTDAGWDFVGESVNGIEDNWFIPQGDYPRLWWEGMEVPMKLTPCKLNCRSQGNWVKAHFTLPEGFTVVDVDSDRPAVLHSFGFQSLPLYVFVNKNKLVEIEAAFERQAVCSLAGDWPQMLTVAGFLADGNIFLGTSTVRIIHPGMKVIEELAWYWLNADCVHPDFCNEIDMNRDSLVNLLDYALLMNIEVEFVTDE